MEEVVTNLTLNETKQKLPQGWRWVKVGDICDTGRGRVISKQYIEKHKGIYPVYSSQTKNDGVFGSIDSYDFHGEWLTWTTDGANAGTVFHREGKFNCTNVCGTIKLKDSEKHNICLRYVSVALGKVAKQHVHIASGNPKLMNGVMQKIMIPIPPLAEQKRIAAVLNEKMAAVERARVAALERVEAVRALSSAWLREVFSFDDGELPHGWRQSVLGDVCEKTATTDPRKTPKEHFVYIDISSIDRTQKRVMNPTEMTGENAPSRARKVVKKGDVLVATTRPNLNAVAIIPESLDGQICSTGFCILRSSKLIASEFLFYFVQTKVFIESVSDLVKGALYPAVTDKQIFAQQIHLPPLPEQKRLVSALNAKMATTEKTLTAAQADSGAL